MAISCSWCKQAVSATPLPLAVPQGCAGRGLQVSRAQLSHAPRRPAPAVPQQGVLLHAAADRGAVLPGGPRRRGHPPYLDPPGPQAPGESHLRQETATPATPRVCRPPQLQPPCHPHPHFPRRTPSKPARRKREHPSRGSLARKGLRLDRGPGGQPEGNRRGGPVSWDTEARPPWSS